MPLQYSNKTILIVDDEEELREYISLLVEPLGTKILFASGGHPAYEIVKNQTIDLIISDAMMPDGNGIEFLDRVQQLPSPRPEFILVSGYAGISVPDAYAKGVAAFFPKPFQAKALFTTVEYALGHQEQKKKRRYPRLVPDSKSTKLEALLSSEKESSVSADIANFSLGGMYVKTATSEKIPKIGEKIEFEIRCSNEPSQKWVGRGIIRWVRNDGFGIEFEDIDQNQSLAEICNYLQTKELM